MQTSQENPNQSTTHKRSTPVSKLLTIARKFHVSVDQLYSAFTTSQAIQAWWWPNGLHSDHVDFDFRKDGKYFINMKGYPDGGGGMTGTFEEIVPNKRIVMMDQFADENGSPISAQDANMAGVWPKFVYITLEFESSEDGSHLILFQEGIPNESQKDCIQGWNEMFDKLENYLKVRKT